MQLSRLSHTSPRANGRLPAGCDWPGSRVRGTVAYCSAKNAETASLQLDAWTPPVGTPTVYANVTRAAREQGWEAMPFLPDERGPMTDMPMAPPSSHEPTHGMNGSQYCIQPVPVICLSKSGPGQQADLVMRRPILPALLRCQGCRGR